MTLMISWIAGLLSATIPSYVKPSRLDVQWQQMEGTSTQRNRSVMPTFYPVASG